jgi:hypothetical protein
VLGVSAKAVMLPETRPKFLSICLSSHSLPSLSKCPSCLTGLQSHCFQQHLEGVLGAYLGPVHHHRTHLKEKVGVGHPQRGSLHPLVSIVVCFKAVRRVGRGMRRWPVMTLQQLTSSASPGP